MICPNTEAVGRRQSVWVTQAVAPLSVLNSFESISPQSVGEKREVLRGCFLRMVTALAHRCRLGTFSNILFLQELHCSIPNLAVHFADALYVCF